MRRAIVVAAGQHHALAILGIASPPFSRPGTGRRTDGNDGLQGTDGDQDTQDQDTQDQDTHHDTPRAMPTLRNLCEAKAQELVELSNLSSCLAFTQVGKVWSSGQLQALGAKAKLKASRLGS